MNAIIPAPMPIGEMQTLASAIAKSQLFGIRTPEQALVLMAIAQAEGRHPVEAARDYDIINNRPAKKAEAMLRDFIQAGGKVQWHSLTDELADATFTHPQTGEVRIDWDMKRAQTAFGKKDMYTKFPRQMLRSRVVSEGVRTLWPLATSGLYVPEEVAEFNGTTLEAESDERAAINREVPLKTAAADIKRPDRIVETDEQKWLRNLETKLSVARSRADVEAIARLKSVETATASGPPDVKQRIAELLAQAWGRFVESEEPADDLGDVEIVGEAKVSAG